VIKPNLAEFEALIESHTPNLAGAAS
jgi:hypothetical protein